MIQFKSSVPCCVNVKGKYDCFSITGILLGGSELQHLL